MNSSASMVLGHRAQKSTGSSHRPFLSPPSIEFGRIEVADFRVGMIDAIDR